MRQIEKKSFLIPALSYINQRAIEFSFVVFGSKLQKTNVAKVIAYFMKALRSTLHMRGLLKLDFFILLRSYAGGIMRHFLGEYADLP